MDTANHDHVEFSGRICQPCAIEYLDDAAVATISRPVNLREWKCPSCTHSIVIQCWTDVRRAKAHRGYHILMETK